MKLHYFLLRKELQPWLIVMVSVGLILTLFSNGALMPKQEDYLLQMLLLL